MQRHQKILVTVLWGLATLAMLSVVGAGLWARRTNALEVLRDVPAFSLTDQNEKTVTDASLRGNVWIAMVFFTQCPGVCPMMTARMAEMQKTISRPDIKIVSFALDPEHDTPQAMKAYAEKFDADQTRWHMLTGPKETMFTTAHAFGLAATPAKEGTPILHSQKVLLIDRSNRIRGHYDTNEDESMKQLAEDAQALARE